MSEFLRWWLVLMLMGAVALPLCLAMFRPLADRGYALSKPFALLVIGFTFWLLNTFRIIPNSRIGIVLVMVLIGGISAAFVYRERDALQAWLKARWRYVLAVEVGFLLVFAVAVALRAEVGQIYATEQPMDFMFLNATTRAENFPPKDPWLSGYTVAYYYFGYLIVGMVGVVAGVPTAIGYNIGLAMTAALAMVAAFGLAYNLIRTRDDVVDAEAGQPALAAKPRKQRRAEVAVVAGERGSLAMSAGPNVRWRPATFGIAGALLLVVAGNFVWVLMFASAYGFGDEGFYSWFRVLDLTANEPRGSWYPSENWAFFNASRLVRLDDAGDFVITEFPMFSFVLGDMHPHVMALPYVALVAAMALAFFRSREPLDVVFWLQRPLLLIGAAILLGGLLFLNTWDVATMAFVIVAAVMAGNYGRTRRITLDLFVQTLSFALPLVLLSVVFYLPFLVSFSNQADGLSVVTTRPGITQAGTRPVHAFLFWGPLLIIALPFVGLRLWAMRGRISMTAVALSTVVPLAVVVAWAARFAQMKWRNHPELAASWDFWRQVTDRGTGWFTAIGIGVIVAASLLTLWLELTADDDREERQGVIFALLLVATAALLALGTEFFYIIDQFHSRMNTVFKLYYQAWVLMAIAGAFGLYYLASPWRHSSSRLQIFRYVWAGGVVLALAGSALYPVGASYNRIQPYFNDDKVNVGGKLDGNAFRSADELEGIAYLNSIAQGQRFVIAEGLGNDYDSAAARISASTGLPTVLGWRGHENQWRGGSEAWQGRDTDVDLLYTTTDVAQMRAIIEKYDISFIVVGDFERKYPSSGLAKFESLPLLFQSTTTGAVKIYRAQ